MKKIEQVNAYEKEGKKFIVIKVDNQTYSINFGLMEYAMKNVKKVGK